MAAAAEIQALQAQLDADPVMRSLRSTSASSLLDTRRAVQMIQRLQELGITLPEGYDLGVRGNIKKKGSTIAKLAKIGGIAGAGTIAAGLIAPVVAGAGAGAAGGTGTAAGSAVGAGAATTTAAQVAKKWYTNPDNWMKVAGTVTTLLGAGKAAGASERAAELQAKSAERAAELEAQTAREALAFQREQWADTQANQAPWLRAGSASLDRLSGLMGLPGAPAAGLPPGVTRSPIAAPGAGTILMRAPTGQQQWVPSEHVAQYQSRGAQVVR